MPRLEVGVSGDFMANLPIRGRNITLELPMLLAPSQRKSDMDGLEDLKRQHEISSQRLAVAEELVYIIAPLAAALVHCIWHQWVWTIATLGLAFLIVPQPYRVAAARAQDTYFRAAGLGKHYREGP